MMFATGLCHTLRTALVLMVFSTTGDAQVNSYQLSDNSAPFTVTHVAPFKLPWRIAFLPDGRMLITEKVGALWLVTPDGAKTPVTNLPPSSYLGRTGSYLDNGGMLGVYTSPTYATDQHIYLTYSEPGPPYGSSLALARARLSIGDGKAAFSPDGQCLFLALGDRNRITPVQDPDQPLGKILRLTLDGKPAAGNPQAGKTGAKTVDIIGWQQDTESARLARIMYTYTFPGDNLTPSETWSTGHRTPYGLVFTPDGKLWELEHGPSGGDELNIIEPGKNYCWPLVSCGRHYNGTAIPHPNTRPDLAKPVLYWTPVIAPGNLVLYKGTVFPEWNGSGLIAGLGSKALIRITFDGNGGAAKANSWYFGRELRDVAVGPDGNVWVLVNEIEGGLYRLTPTQR